MKWQEVRELYPDQFVKIQILHSHINGNKKYIDEVAIINPIKNNREATIELVNAKEGILVYHTRNERIEIEIRNITGYRGIIQ